MNVIFSQERGKAEGSGEVTDQGQDKSGVAMTITGVQIGSASDQELKGLQLDFGWVS